jgi:hypothetical protein
MSFLDDFESKMDGVNDTVEFVIRVAIITLSAVILVVVAALAVALFVPNELVDSTAILETINPAFQTIVGAFVGLLGGLSLNANARDKDTSNEPTDPIVGGDLPPPDAPKPEATVVAPAAVVAEPAVEVEDLDDDEDDMAPWEKYRNDLRYDANGDGVVDEDDFPDWRNPVA